MAMAASGAVMVDSGGLFDRISRKAVFQAAHAHARIERCPLLTLDPRCYGNSFP